MPIVKTSSKGQIVIPKEIRKELGITPGKKVLFRVVGQHAEIAPLPEDSIKAIYKPLLLLLQCRRAAMHQADKQRLKPPLRF